MTDRRKRRRWRDHFPYHWDDDERVGRREFLRISVFTSGALFAGTAFLALLGRRDQRSGEPRAIMPADELREGEPVYFNYPGSGDDAVLLRLPTGEIVAYDQKCTHLACAVYYQQDRNWLFCPCHDGAFSVERGEPIKGPPQRRLPRIRIEVRDGMIYALERAP